MKKTTGELSSTIIVAISVAILVAFFFYTIWPMIDANFKSQTSCEKAICESKPDDKGMVNCILCDSVTGTDHELRENCATEGTRIRCRYKG